MAAEAGRVRRRPGATNTRRMYARRRRTILLAVLMVAVLGLLVSRYVDRSAASRTGSAAPPAATPLATGSGVPAPATSAAGTPSTGPTGAARASSAQDAASDMRARRIAPDHGQVPTARFDYARGHGPVLGTAGPVRRFKVAVESGAGVGGPDFANAVDRILGDPRSWTAGRRFRLQRVPPGTATEFTVFLASPATSERMCADGGLTTDGYTSCRLRGQVIINVDRWEHAVPGYDAPLATYQAYAINHEVGHQLGHGHEACPAAGRPAPVMQQQTYGLKGCTANAWPYLNGRRYAGEPTA